MFVNEYERAYECRNGQAFTLTNTADNDGVMNDTIVELEPTWRIQAFEFRDDGSDFGNCEFTLIEPPTLCITVPIFLLPSLTHYFPALHLLPRK